MGAAEIPLAKRIGEAEAFVFRAWERRKEIPPGRGWESMRQAEAKRAAEMAAIDAMLDKMLPLYDQRTLATGVTPLDTSKPADWTHS